MALKRWKQSITASEMAPCRNDDEPMPCCVVVGDCGHESDHVSDRVQHAVDQHQGGYREGIPHGRRQNHDGPAQIKVEGKPETLEPPRESGFEDDAGESDTPHGKETMGIPLSAYDVPAISA